MVKPFFFKRQFIFLLIKIAVTLVLLWALTHTAQLKLELFATFFYQPFFTLAMIGLILLGVLVNTWRWYRLNSVQGIDLPFSYSALATYLGIAFNSILPGSVGGDVIRCYYVIKRFPRRKSGAVLSTLLDRVCGLMGIIVISSVIVIFRYPVFSHRPAVSSLVDFCFTLMMAGGIALLLTLFLPKQLGLSEWLKRRFTFSQGRWLKPILSLLDAVRLYRKSKFVLFEALGAAIVTQLLLLSVILLINHVMGLPEVPAYVYMLALALGQIANLLPFTPGGVGIGELAFANVVLIFGNGMISAYATVFFAFRLLMTLLYLPGVIWGIFGFEQLRKGNWELIEEG